MNAILIPVLISIAFLTVLGIVLALLLIIAQKRILNYGICKIDVNQGDRVLEVQGGSALLFSLAENEIFIPSACGGRGSCAYCKVKVLEGGGIIGPVEEPYLSAEERKAFVRLSCQVKVRNDLKIKIPKELFAVKRIRAKLEHKKPLTYDIVELRLKLLEQDEIDFIAGQYVQLESPEYKGRAAVMRAYSISSLPSDKKKVELNIRLVPDGICTTWIFDYLKEGDDIWFSGPYGEFHLSDTDAPVIFIAGGSGMAPIWSIVRDMVEKGNKRKACYFFGARTQQDLFYADELRLIEQEHAWFKFVPSLSGEPEDSDWQGERGLITSTVKKYFPKCAKYEAYLCGSPGMIDACIKVLTEGGMPMEKIFYDKFA
jgi:Na+-transporting NADH:ubiquinone oxidoreductase subunit F